MLAAAAWAQIRFGLQPFEDVRRAVLAVRERRAKRLARRCPEEIQPLADQVNALLDSDDALLDAANAAKWAREAISITAVAEADHVNRTLADDGPGVAATDRERLGTRGMRLKANTPGYSIGLAIAREIVLTYAGTLTFDEAAISGLAVRLELPAAQAPIGHASRR